MTIGIIGAGKVGTTLGAYLTKNRIAVSGYYSRTFESAIMAAEYTKTKAYQSLKELVEVSDTLFITTPDREIVKVWDCIAEYELKNKVICHFSGSLSSNVFSGIEASKATGCSIHPMYAFCDKFTAYEQFHTACLTLEGHEEALKKLKELFGKKLGHKLLTVSASDKIKYHAAAALASNYMIGLFQASLDLLRECGFSEEDSTFLLEPLVSGNVAAMLENGTKSALTGPIERNDVETIQKHLKAIESTDVEEIYRSIGKKLVEIAQRKNDDRDYTVLKNIFNKD